jgi:site-specific DNA-cytosine methylase
VVLRDIIEGRAPPHMPDPAEGLVDVITAGPPCQGECFPLLALVCMADPLAGFSRANMATNNKSRPMDPRNMLVATTLAFIDVYRPRFVVLENVGGLVDPANGKLGEWRTPAASAAYAHSSSQATSTSRRAS